MYLSMCVVFNLFGQRSIDPLSYVASEARIGRKYPGDTLGLPEGDVWGT